MNRNTELHFGQTPQIDLKRSKFERSKSHKTSFNVGDVIPIYVDADILPGDTVQMDMAELVRMATPIYPIMDNLYMDIYWFFVPHRLVWDHWQNFWGENDDPWTQQVEYEIPQLEAPQGGWTEGTIADYMGIPTKVDGISINAMPMRAYCKIWNDWFRDENLKSNCHIYTDDTTRTGQTGAEEGYDPVTGTEFGGKPAKVAKFHDLFTSALPQPQKGDPVQIPITGSATVRTGDPAFSEGDKLDPIRYGLINNGTISQKHIWNVPAVTPPEEFNQAVGVNWSVDTTTGNIKGISNDSKTVDGSTTADQFVNDYAPINLYADLSTMTATTINQLRTAFAIQKYYENAGLHGTRYIEYLRGVFGVTSSDARLQRAEYLGGKRIPINIDQVLQTSSTDAVSPQGNTGAFSCTIDRGDMFTKSFEEHGTLMCLIAIRTDHTYQQGLDRQWTRKKWTDFYNPFFANLGEQAILNENIYAQGTTADKEAFGYQEAWAEYRYGINRVSGYMRSNAKGSLDVWHFADDYSSQPYLSSEWIDEPYTNVDRTIAVTSQLTHQFIGDFFFKTYYTRAMPIYSVPGLIDHV